MKKIKEFTKASIGIGVGTVALDKMGADTSGMKAMSGMMPAVGGLVGAGMVMEQMKKLKGKR